jgi:outer membrane lipoprotein carrier protein
MQSLKGFLLTGIFLAVAVPLSACCESQKNTKHEEPAAPVPSPVVTPLPEISPQPVPSITPVVMPSSIPRVTPSSAPSPAPSRVPTKAPAAAKPVELNKDLPRLLAEIENKYSTATTFEAEFSQINTVAALEQKKTSSGKIKAKRPGKLRWETLSPDKNLLVSDGKKFWFYTPPFEEGEHGQLIEKKASQVQSRLANALLSGSFSIAKDFKITEQGNSKFLMTAKRSSESVKSAELTINPKTRLIEKVVLEHKGGNRTEITLSNIQLGKPMEDALFKFVAPAGTDRLEE